MEVTRPKEDWNRPQEPLRDNKKYSCGILAILFGPFGIHKFLLGYRNEGIITLILSVVTCGIATSVIGLIEGIIYLCMSDEAFYQTYQVEKRGWF